MGRSSDAHVVIIGGGASGVLMAVHLLRASGSVRVTIVEREGDIGRGLAYRTSHAEHLLNVRAANMSAFTGDADNFLKWLASDQQVSSAHPLNPFQFVERRVYGRYLESLIGEYLDDRHTRLSIVRGEAVSIEESRDGVGLRLSDGRRIEGDAAVFATGNEPRLHGHLDTARESPWVSPGEAGVRQNARIAIRGTGLTLVDYALALVAHGHVGPILAISRRGQLPRVHGETEPLELNRNEIPFGASFLTLLRWFRAYVKAATAEGHDWRSCVDSIRPHSWRIWTELPIAAQQQFLRHGRVWWEVHRHRMAPDADAKISRLLQTGQLEVVAAKFAAVTSEREGLFVHFRRRGQAVVEKVRVNRFIDCSGVSSDPRTPQNPIVRDLLDKGLARADRHGLGLDVDRDWALIDLAGEPSRRLFAIGPLTRAAAWETIAVPDIRVQCEELARRLSWQAHNASRLRMPA